MATLTQNPPRYGALFEEVRGRLPGARQAWLSRLRAEGLARFNALGWPKPTDEDWRFTPLSPVSDTTFAFEAPRPAGAAAALAQRLLSPFSAYRLVFLNGRYVPALSHLPQAPFGATIAPLSAALDEEPGLLEAHLGRQVTAQANAFTALNAAFFTDGALVRVKGAAFDKPVHLVFASSAAEGPVMSFPRVLVLAEADSQLTLIEEYVSLDAGVSFIDAAVEIEVGAGARVEHYRLQRENDKALNASNVRVRQEKGGRYDSHVVTLGGAWTRNDLNVLLDAEGAHCELNGLYLAGGSRHMDNHTWVDHAKPHGTSRELYKGILDGSARTVFNGLINVHPGAQKTDAQVYNKNLLLSDDCLAYTNPEFRISANDVQCKHGAAIGQISSDALFYLRARGINGDEARRLLVHAFASEMVERVAFEPVREALQARMTEEAGLEI